MLKTIASEKKKNNLPQNRTTPTIAQVQNYFGNLVTRPTYHTNQDAALIILTCENHGTYVMLYICSICFEKGTHTFIYTQLYTYIYIYI